MSEESLSYKHAGVDIDAGNALVEKIKADVKRTKRPEVLGGLGGFGALCSIPNKYKEPILVAGTDGVGTKLKLAIDLNKHDTIGIDLVAMCVNDIVVQGAEPLFFLDYYASSKLDVDVAADVVKGIADGCEMANCSLIGGETAEMPGLYQTKDYDLAGFCVGVVEREEIIDSLNVRAGDILIAIASSGPHSNGYSLIRKIIELTNTDIEAEMLEGKPLSEHLIAPTKIYVKTILQLIKKIDIHAISHLTGGGFQENIPRVLPENVVAVIDESSWEIPAIFKWLQEKGNVAKEEMYRTFNCGVGMVLVIPENDVELTLGLLNQIGEKSWRIGEIIPHKDHSEQVIFK